MGETRMRTFYLFYNMIVDGHYIRQNILFCTQKITRLSSKFRKMLPDCCIAKENSVFDYSVLLYYIIYSRRNASLPNPSIIHFRISILIYEN